MHLLMLIYGDTATIVLYGDGVILIDSYFYMCAETCHRLVDGVIHSLVDKMVQSLLADVSDVHSRALTHGFQSLEHLNVTRGIILFLVQLFFCHFLYFR